MVLKYSISPNADLLDSFPKEIYVTDAEYAYRDTSGYLDYPTDNRLPYFYYALPPESYSGLSGDKKQFNSGCNIH